VRQSSCRRRLVSPCPRAGTSKAAGRKSGCGAGELPIFFDREPGVFRPMCTRLTGYTTSSGSVRAPRRGCGDRIGTSRKGQFGPAPPSVLAERWACGPWSFPVLTAECSAQPWEFTAGCWRARAQKRPEPHEPLSHRGSHRGLLPPHEAAGHALPAARGARTGKTCFNL